MSTYLVPDNFRETKRAFQLAHYFLDIKSPVSNGRGFFCFDRAKTSVMFYGHLELASIILGESTEEERLVFKSIKGLVPGNIVLNFVHDPKSQFDIVASGYHDAAKSIVKDLEEQIRFPDYLAYPVIFLYRHSLELYMKAVVLVGAKVVGVIDDEELDHQKFISRHTLTSMLPALQVIFSSMKWEWDFGVEYAKTFEDFRRIVSEIEALDRDSFAFRYPVDKKMKAVLPKHLHFNLFHFAATMNPILDGLDGAVTGIEDRWDKAAPILYEVQQIIRGTIEGVD